MTKSIETWQKQQKNERKNAINTFQCATFDFRFVFFVLFGWSRKGFLRHTNNENILGKCFRSGPSLTNPRISPLTINYECPQLSLSTITSILETNNVGSSLTLSTRGVSKVALSLLCLSLLSPCYPALFAKIASRQLWPENSKTQDESQWIVAQRLLSTLTIPGFN